MVNEVLNYSAAVEMLRVPLIVRQTTFFPIDISMSKLKNSDENICPAAVCEPGGGQRGGRVLPRPELPRPLARHEHRQPRQQGQRQDRPQEGGLTSTVRFFFYQRSIVLII